MSNASNKGLFSKRLRECMDARGESIYSLAPKIGMAPTSISAYLNEKSLPKLPVMKELSSVLGVNGFWLAGVPGFERYTGIDGAITRRIPILGRVAAGSPITAIENIEGYEVVEGSDRSQFCLRVTGDSMVDAHIPNGSIVYCLKASDTDVLSGDIAVVIIDGEDATVKKVVMESEGIYLIPANTKYMPKYYKKSEMKDVHIVAKVTAVKFDL